jgi:hypothetical protein
MPETGQLFRRETRIGSYWVWTETKAILLQGALASIHRDSWTKITRHRGKIGWWVEIWDDASTRPKPPPPGPPNPPKPPKHRPVS